MSIQHIINNLVYLNKVAHNINISDIDNIKSKIIETYELITLIKSDNIKLTPLIKNIYTWLSLVSMKNPSLKNITNNNIINAEQQVIEDQSNLNGIIEQQIHPFLMRSSSIAFPTEVTHDHLPLRGTITQQLHKCIIDNSNAIGYFVMSDSSNKDFSEEFGAMRADILESIPESAINKVSYDAINQVWRFPHDAGIVTCFESDGITILPAVANPEYSSLKRFSWNNEIVTANMPLIVWGNKPGQRIIVDKGGLDPLIRSNPPSPFFVGNGPSGKHSSEEHDPLMRYKGGQAVDIDLESNPKTVTMKLHKGVYSPDKVPYYTVFDTNKLAAACFMGVPHVPKFSNLGRFEDKLGTGLVVQFANGIPNSKGGPARFQPGIASYPGGQSKKYSPMWVIWWAFFTNNTSLENMFITDRNVGEGAKPKPGSMIHGFDPASKSNFDPFQIKYKGDDLTTFVNTVTKNGQVETLSELFGLSKKGHVLLTEAPAGLRLNSSLQPSLIVNCPVPVTYIIE